MAGCRGPASGELQGAGVAGQGEGAELGTGGDAEESSAASGAPEPGADPDAGRPHSDAPLVIALPGLPETLDPLGEIEPWAWRVADDLVFEGLVRRDPGGAPWVKLSLADRCELDDPAAARSVTCHLRPDLRFHDGAPVTPEDVVYSLEYWLDPRRSWARQRRGLGSLRRVEIVDGPGGGLEGRDPGRWIRVSFDRPQPLALERLAEIKVVPRQLHRGRGEAFGSAPVGTGPMRVVALDGDRWELRPMEGWRRGDTPAPPLRGLVLRGIDDGAQALTMLRRGEVQVLASLPPSYVPAELAKPGMAPRFRAFRTSPPRFDLLLFNAARGVSESNRTRQALEVAVPRARIEREIYGVPGVDARAPVDLDEPREIQLAPLAELPPGTEVLPELWSWRDPGDDALGASTAGAVLDQLGWKIERGLRRKSGQSLRVTLTWDGGSGRPSQIAGALRSAWGSLGVVVPNATASWTYLLTLFKRGEFDVAMVRLSLHDDEDLSPWFHSRGDTNLSGVSDARLDAALGRYQAARQREERAAAEREVARRLAELRVASVIHAPVEVMLFSRQVTKIEFADDLPRLDRLVLLPVSETGW